LDREFEIMRKHMIAIAAAAALGAATMATTAFAAPHGGAAHMGGGAPMARMGGGGGGVPHANFGAANVGRANGAANFAHNGGAHFAGPHGNFAAGGFDHGHRRGFPGYGIVGGLYAFGGPDYYGYNDYSDGCWQRQLVPTPYGLQWQLVDVCE
jgi:hypothetical protein